MIKMIDHWVDEEENSKIEPSQNLYEAVTSKVIKNLLKTEEDYELANYAMNYRYCLFLGAEPSYISAKYLKQDYLFNGDEHVFP